MGKLSYTSSVIAVSDFWRWKVTKQYDGVTVCLSGAEETAREARTAAANGLLLLASTNIDMAGIE